MGCNMHRYIWIMNHYAGNMFFDQGGRHYSFAKYLKRFGYEPVIFCCNAIHNGKGVFFQDDSLWHVHMAEEIQVSFVFVRGRPYIGNGFGRVLNMIDFYRNVKVAAKEFAKEYGAPDIIFASSVHPLTLVAGIQLAKYFHVKCICEIRDLWPESIVSYGIAGRNNPMVIAMRRLEKWIYANADSLIFTREGDYDYIKEQRWENAVPKSKAHYLNNGVDLEAFDYNKQNHLVDDVDLKNDEIFKVIYTGAVRHVNQLGKLLDVAKIIKNPRVKFLVWGKGNELPILAKRVQDENISNVEFKGYIDKKFIPYITSCADINLAHNAYTEILRFGISWNKIFDYMAAGKPIVIDAYSKYNPIVQCGAGIEIKNPTPENIAKAIEDVADMDKEMYDRYCCNARKGAKKYDFKNLTQELLKIMTGKLHK